MEHTEVIKHSAAIQISNQITLLQRRAWNALLANAYRELPTQERHTIKIADLMKLVGMEDSHNEQHVKDLCESLVQTTVKWNLLDKDKKVVWGVFALLAEATIVGGALTYAYGPTLRERLYNPRIYARISLSLQNELNSKHSLAIYELCVDYFIDKLGRGETPWISLNDFRTMLGLDSNEYNPFRVLNDRLIKLSLKEINKKTDLDVSVEFQKEQRKVSALKFHIKPKANRIQLVFGPPNSLAEMDPLYARLTNYFSLSESQAKEVMSKITRQEVEEYLGRIEEDYRAGIIKNIGAYTYKAIMDGFAKKRSPLEVERENQMKAQQEEVDRKAKETEQRKRGEAEGAEQNRANVKRILEWLNTLSREEKQRVLTECAAQVTDEEGRNTLEAARKTDRPLDSPLVLSILSKYLLEMMPK